MAAHLSDLGYVGAHALLGGFEAWVKEGFATERRPFETASHPEPLAPPGQ